MAGSGADFQTEVREGSMKMIFGLLCQVKFRLEGLTWRSLFWIETVNEQTRYSWVRNCVVCANQYIDH